MPHSSASALITDQGQRVLFRIHGRFFDVTQEELRALLGLPPGPAGLGISIDRDRLRFEFASDNQTVELSERQLLLRLTKQMTTKT